MTDLPYIGRELSWLGFNRRVLEQARDASLPPLERLRFIEIAGKSLDEFFMVRVGRLLDRKALGEAIADDKTRQSPGEILEGIYRESAALVSLRDELYAEVSRDLDERGVIRRTHRLLNKRERRKIAEIFKRDMLPLLSPQILDARHPFPHMENLGLYIVASLKSEDASTFGILPIPKPLGRLISLPESGGYMLCEEVILHHLPKVFRGYKSENRCIVRVTRNADLDLIDDLEDDAPDFAQSLKKRLKKRERLSPVRLQFFGKVKPSVKKMLASRLGLDGKQIFSESTPLSLDYCAALAAYSPPENLPGLTHTPYRPPQSVPASVSVCSMAQRQDILLAYPYDSMAPLVRLISEAAEDPSVLTIKITLYRLGGSSQIAAALCAAAENGKEVTAILELRARFDEKSNIEWSKRLEESGCRVLYGPEGFKVHAKLLIITLRKDGRLQTITHIGTGNFNERTARQYTDLSLITSRPDIGADAVRFFQNVSICNLDAEYKRLLAAPGSMKAALLGLIDGEISRAARGCGGEIFAKLNSLTDKEIIDKLLEASASGVSVRLLVRGICCLRPGVPGISENIEVTSIVGRFLEHSRVYWFGPQESRQLYISSADWMTRNTERRAELAAPVQDPALRARIESMMELMWRDNVKAWRLGPDGSYTRAAPGLSEPVDAQERLMLKSMPGAPASSF